MAECKACGEWFGTATPQDLCPTCERALKRLGVYVAPVRHGKWINAYISGVHHLRCSECGEYTEATWHASFDYKYCPNCGAKMDADG